MVGASIWWNTFVKLLIVAVLVPAHPYVAALVWFYCALEICLPMHLHDMARRQR